MIDVVLLGGALGLALYLCWRRRRARRLLDPELAPPGFGPEPAHPFDETPNHPELPTCWTCGGGRKHSVHHGVPWRPAP